MINIILALDLGSTIGWAVVGGDVGKYGEKHFPGLRPARFAAFYKWLEEMMNDRYFDYVIFERPFSRGLHATRSLWGMAGIVELVAERHEHACLDIVPSTLKKWATGNGRASKAEMIAASYRLINKTSVPGTLRKHNDVIREHEADAIILGLYAAETIKSGE